MSDNLQLQPPLQPHFAAAQELDLEQASFTFDGGTGFEQNFGSSWSYTMENPASLSYSSDDSGSFQQNHHDSGYYDPQNGQIPSKNSSFFPSLTSTSDQLTKWDKWLHCWYVKCDRRLPSDEELLLFQKLIQTPKQAIKARFHQYYAVDNYKDNSMVYMNYDIPADTATTHRYQGAAVEDLASSVLQQPQESITWQQPTMTAPSTSPAPPTSIERDVKVALTSSLVLLIETLSSDRRKRGCGIIRRHERRTGNYQCTSGCGRRFREPSELFRHENSMYMQELWFCTRCGNLDDASEEHLFYRKDKFRDHLRKQHPDWLSTGGLGDCKVPQGSFQFPRRCGFCDRNRFRACNWRHRCEHIASHFKRGATMDAWRHWSEDDEETADPEDPHSGNVDSDPDDDDDDDGDEDNEYDEKDFHDTFTAPPDADRDLNAAFSGFPDYDDPTFGGFFGLSNFSSFNGQNSCIEITPIPKCGQITSSDMMSQRFNILSRSKISQKGGTASVYKVRVQADQYGSDEVERYEPKVFVIKQYGENRQTSYNREVEACSRLSHPHIIECIGTFLKADITGCQTYNLVFPAAECDLLEYMKTKSPLNNQDTAKWLAEQFLGLAQGLQAVHQPNSDNSSKSNSVGYHFDLKPENVLVVGDRLSISDFGFSEFDDAGNRHESKLRPNGGTHTYTPPEFVQQGLRRPVSQAYDLWSLGCVYLELMVWSLFEFNGLREFKSCRSRARQKLGHSTDPLFHDGQNILPEVREWNNHLRSKIRADDFISGKLFDLIEHHLLQGNPIHRFNAPELVGHLEDILQNSKRKRLHSDVRITTESVALKPDISTIVDPLYVGARKADLDPMKTFPDWFRPIEPHARPLFGSPDIRVPFWDRSKPGNLCPPPPPRQRIIRRRRQPRDINNYWDKFLPRQTNHHEDAMTEGIRDVNAAKKCALQALVADPRVQRILDQSKNFDQKPEKDQSSGPKISEDLSLPNFTSEVSTTVACQVLLHQQYHPLLRGVSRLEASDSIVDTTMHPLNKMLRLSNISTESTSQQLQKRCFKLPKFIFTLVTIRAYAMDDFEFAQSHWLNNCDLLEGSQSGSDQTSFQRQIFSEARIVTIPKPCGGPGASTHTTSEGIYDANGKRKRQSLGTNPLPYFPSTSTAVARSGTKKRRVLEGPKTTNAINGRSLAVWYCWYCSNCGYGPHSIRRKHGCAACTHKRCGFCTGETKK